MIADQSRAELAPDSPHRPGGALRLPNLAVTRPSLLAETVTQRQWPTTEAAFASAFQVYADSLCVYQAMFGCLQRPGKATDDIRR